MNDLVEFLRARLDEKEARAWAIHDVTKCDALLYEEDMGAAAAATPGCDCGYPQQVRHVRLHDPARELREVEAKRQRMAEHQPDDDGDCRTCVTKDPDYPNLADLWVPKPWPCPTICGDLAVYSDRPGFKPEWAS